MKRILMLIPAMAFFLPAGCGPTESYDGVIGVSVLTVKNPYFVDLADAIKEEAAKHNLKVIIRDGETLVANQKRQVDEFIAMKVDAIVLCPCDSEAIGSVIITANEAGIPVFTADVACEDETANVESHVATDNYGGGKLAGETMVELLDGNGKVAILDYPEVESVKWRTKGFHEIVDRVEGIEIVTTQNGFGDTGQSEKAATEILQAFPDLDAFFAVNDPSGLGAATALQKARKADRVKIIAFDAQPIGRKAVKEGKFHATIVQYPRRIGSSVVKQILNYISAGDVEKEIRIDCTVYGKAEADEDPTLKD